MSSSAKHNTKPFSILLSRSVVHEARIDVHAESASEAREEALAQAETDLVNWVQVNAEMVAEVHYD